MKALWIRMAAAWARRVADWLDSEPRPLSVKQEPPAEGRLTVDWAASSKATSMLASKAEPSVPPAKKRAPPPVTTKRTRRVK